MTQGFVYIVYGAAAQSAAMSSIATLRKHNNKPVHVIGNRSLDYATVFEFELKGTPGRWAKVNLAWLSPWSDTCYLDADTIIHANLDIGFDILRDGWDMVICHSANQGDRWLEHIEDEEICQTVEMLAFRALQFQAGVIWFNRDRCLEFFSTWKREWGRWQRQDQAAFLRALSEVPIKIWLLGHPWRNGQHIRHLYGSLRRTDAS